MTEKVLRVVYTADPAPVKRALSQLESSHATYSSKMSAVGAKLKGVGTLAASSLALPLSILGGVAVQAYARFAQANAQTQAALRSTHGVSGETAKGIANLSESLSQLTQTDRSQVQAAENVLLSFTNVRNEVGKGNNIFDRASLSAANLSARMGIALPSAMKLVGKALQDPIKGLTSLARVGVTFTDQQKAQIKTMVDSGHSMDAQKLILDQLTTRFGGSAAAMGANAPPLQKLKVMFDELSITVGQLIMPVINLLVSGLQALFQWFTSLPGPVQKVVEATVLAVVAWKVLNAAFEASPWGVVIAAIVIAAGLIIKHWTAIKEFLLGIWNAIKAVVGPYFHAIAAVIGTEVAIARAVIVGAWTAIKTVVTGIWTGLKIVAGIEFNALKLAVLGPLNVLKATWGAIWNGMKSVVEGIWGGIESAVKVGLNAIISIINGLIHAYNAIPFAPNIPTIPHLARGVQSFGGGLALVGEEGPEIVQLPRGSRVIPNSKAVGSIAPLMSQVMSTGRGGGNVLAVVNVGGSVITERDLVEIVRRVLFDVARRNGGSTGIS